VLASASFYNSGRFEPLTHALRCVQNWAQWSRAQEAGAANALSYVLDFNIVFGAAKRIRTPDPRITNALLYRLSYCGILKGSILTRGIARRKAGVEFSDVAQCLW
jgi:hypothetical protein